MLLQSGIHAHDLGISLTICRARIAVEGAATGARRVRQSLAVALVQQDSNGQMERMMSLTLEAVEQLLNARLVRNWRIRIGFLPWGFGWILPSQAVHMKQFLGGLIVGLKITVLQRPGG